MHVTDELPVRRVDVQMGHHWTSTAPGSHFRRALMLNRHGVNRLGVPTLLTVNHLTVTSGRRGEVPVARGYALEELPDLAARAGAELEPRELARLTERVAELRRHAHHG